MGCDIHTITEIKRQGKWERVPEVPAEFTERCYSVFAFLANVRNSWDIDGFKPKGLPEDISGLKFDKYDDDDDYAIDFSAENENFHSHSYLSLQELLSKDTSDLTMTKCKILKEFYNKFTELGGVMPDGMVVVEREQELCSIVEIIRESIEPTVIVKWPNDNTKTHPVIEGIKNLQSIADKYDVSPENIRIVFAFDN